MPSLLPNLKLGTKLIYPYPFPFNNIDIIAVYDNSALTNSCIASPLGFTTDYKKQSETLVFFPHSLPIATKVPHNKYVYQTIKTEELQKVSYKKFTCYLVEYTDIEAILPLYKDYTIVKDLAKIKKMILPTLRKKYRNTYVLFWDKEGLNSVKDPINILLSLSRTEDVLCEEWQKCEGIWAKLYRKNSTSLSLGDIIFTNHGLKEFFWVESFCPEYSTEIPLDLG